MAQVGRKKIYTITTKGKKTLQLLAEQHKKVFAEHKRLIKLLSGMSTKTNYDDVKLRTVTSPSDNKWLRYNMDVIGELKQSVLEMVQQPFNEKKAESWRKTMIKEIAVIKQLKKKMKKKKPIIELEDVWKIYKMGKIEVPALQGLNLKVFEGDFLAIQGPSGSGKSTAMNLVGCLDIPTKGVVRLDGTDIKKLTESRLAQIRGRKIGFIFQKFNLIPTLSTKENVKLPMGFQNMPDAKREKQAKALLKLVDLDKRMSHKPSELSGGQQQRVAIARALAMDPPVILADEPTGNLDSKTGKIVMEFLESMHKKGRTIIMVTHDDKLAHYAERIVILKDGQIVQELKGDKKKTK